MAPEANDCTNAVSEIPQGQQRTRVVGTEAGQTTVHLRGLPMSVCEPKAFRALLSAHDFGEDVKQVRILPLAGKKSGCVVMKMKSEASAKKLSKFFHGRQLGLGGPIAASLMPSGLASSRQLLTARLGLALAPLAKQIGDTKDVPAVVHNGLDDSADGDQILGSASLETRSGPEDSASATSSASASDCDADEGRVLKQDIKAARCAAGVPNRPPGLFFPLALRAVGAGTAAAFAQSMNVDPMQPMKVLLPPPGLQASPPGLEMPRIPPPGIPPPGLFLRDGELQRAAPTQPLKL